MGTEKELKTADMLNTNGAHKIYFNWTIPICCGTRHVRPSKYNKTDHTTKIENRHNTKIVILMEGCKSWRYTSELAHRAHS